jgi:BolA protein
MSNTRIVLLDERLRAALAPEHLEIIDDSAAHAGHTGARDGGGHFNILIVSPAFAGKSRLQRHRLVYQAVQDLMPKDIHALSIKALDPAEL